jgi:hypothetical protein
VKPDGKLRLSAAATAQLREAGATRVAILWDKQKQKIALQVVPDDDHSAFRLSYSSAQNSADIAARSFLSSIKWVASAAVDIPLKWNESERMFEGKVQAQ